MNFKDIVWIIQSVTISVNWIVSYYISYNSDILACAVRTVGGYFTRMQTQASIKINIVELNYDKKKLSFDRNSRLQLDVKMYK